jgi:uncharacterized caspase-like protein
VTDDTEAPKQQQVSQDRMREAIRDFADALDENTVAVFAFMGHGMEHNGKNYLLPQEQVSDDRRLDTRAICLQDDVMAEIATSQPLATLIFLDCCRQKVTMQRSTRGTAVGLGSLTGPAGTIIMYATAPGSLAQDGDGTHGAFTEALLQHIDTPNLSINDSPPNPAALPPPRCSGSDSTTCAVRRIFMGSVRA